ncbi:PREDICTED: UPF0488 protein CG14286 [Polistes dominula]|uniref:UPF0488 protein CG14286 n=1 Tax=Polistes dominula TaxID=743375 RepID=A0ABM1J4Y8_POLDO|nr:PREDICTED: UPF0488 protein CG14286 [Polistes dominula]
MNITDNKVPSKKKSVKTNSEEKNETSTSVEEGTSGLNQTAEDQFVLELYWCIQELESTLVKGNLQAKQEQDILKSVNILKSNTAPLIKKRQIMRNKLGDYRKKMIQDEQKLKKQVAFVTFTNKTRLNKKSVFLKKATINVKQSSVKIDNESQEHLQDSSDNKDSCKIDKDSSKEFRFNFQSVN